MSMSANLQLESVLESARSRRSDIHVIVVGDVMLDRYFWGGVNRISPEAPVPVVRMERETTRPGGAANVAMNLAGLGVQTSIVGGVGNDRGGEQLCDLLKDCGINTEGIIRVEDRPTTLKMRVIGDRQQMLRIDSEVTRPLAPQDEDRLFEQFQGLLKRGDAVILSDYAKGVITERTGAEIIDAARSADCPVIVDPKVDDYTRYRRATAVTPNHHELAQATGEDVRNIEGFLKAGQQLREAHAIDHLVVTRGKQGISLVDDSGVEHFPAISREVYDVSGAGDTVVATLTVGRSVGMSWADAIALANLAAGVVIEKVGTAPIEYDELLEAARRREQLAQPKKIYELQELERQVEDWCMRGEQIVFTNGCFDLLHAGHVTYLERAAQEGSRLIVGLNTDHSVRELKGAPRPIIPEEQRARVLASLESVDAVVLFGEETPIRLINTLRPDVLVKGQDYEKSEVVGADEVEGWGGKVALVPLIEGLSTSRIIEDIRSTITSK